MGSDRLSRMFGAAACVVVLAATGSACAPPAPPPQDVAADEAKLKADAGIWFEHIRNGNADAAANLYAEDAVVLPDKAPALHGRAEVRDYFAGMIAEIKAAGLTFKDNGPNGAGVSGDMGWISGTYTVVDASGQTVDTGKYLSVHHRTNGTWLYIRDIWNSDLAPPAAADAGKGK
ncbi:MAG: nuclear transport factor 2 family protein [Vicinamibacterales bacterium]